MMQEIQEENRKLQVSGYEWDITLTEQDVEEHGWIRGDSLLHAFETIASAHVDSLDMGFEPLQVAKLHALESGIQVDYVQETVEEHAAKHAGQYDVVTCMEMLEHVPDPQSVVHACARLVKPGGQVFFSTINRNGKAWLMAVVGAEYVMKMVPKGTHDVKKFIKPAELLGWVDQTTLKEQHIIGLHYNPLTNTFKLAPGVDVNYMLHTTAKQD